MPIRYVTQPAAEEGKIIVFPVDDEITFTDKEKEVLKLAIEDIRTGWTSSDYVTNSIGFCGDPTILLDASPASRLALCKAELLIALCDPQYQIKTRGGGGVHYCSLSQANTQYVIQQNDQRKYPQLAGDAECGMAWFNYLIEHH